jgi:glyoxylase-like metal-dependent hydrolase (beta-lactamase superfamily II)
MTEPARMSRRHALMLGAALPLASALGAAPARAAAEMKGMTPPRFNRFKLGGYDVTALLAGTRTVEAPHKIFGLNVDDATFAEVSQRAFIPADRAQFFFTPTIVNTGSDLVLFDTGPSGAGIAEALAAAGYAPDQVDVVVLTHMHGDHIGGMTTDGAPTFANARYVTGRAEYEFWAGAANEGFEKNVRPFADRMTFIGDGASVAGGITGIDAFGHTPGHMAFRIEDGGAALVLIADAANHYVWSLAHPDWEVSFDRDKSAAAATRRRLLGMLAAERTPFIGYHMPFPAMGFVEARGDGFHYVPASYQMML